MSDPELAALMRRLNPPAPVERIVGTDILLTVMNRLRRGKRVAVLACGHRKITAATDRARCLECHRMILNGDDYAGFRGIT